MMDRGFIIRSKRIENKLILNRGLDTLVFTGGTPEDREQLADEMKDLFDAHIKLEETCADNEYCYGRLHGILIGGMSVIGGYLFGLAIRPLFKK